MTQKRALLDLVAQTAKALGSGSRLEILELLAQRERGVGELAALAGLNVTTASAHLQVLKEAGLVDATRDGTRINYELAGDDVAALMVTLAAVAESRRPDVEAARRVLIPELIDEDSRPNFALAEGERDAVFLDVRPAEEFEAGHLPHAINIPRAELSSRLNELPPGCPVVVYCRGRYCRLSYDALQVLQAAGHTTRVLPAGALEWRARRGESAA